MRRFLSLLLLTAPLLSSCGSTPTSDPLSGIARLTTLWAQSTPPVKGQLYLSGDQLFAGGKLKAFNLVSRSMSFTLAPEVDYLRSSYATVGDVLVVVTGASRDTLTVIDRDGRILNSFSLPGGRLDSGYQVGPYVAGNSVYLVSGPRLFKFRSADLLSPTATPVWIKAYPGLGLASLLVENEDRVYVATHDDASRDLVALDGNGIERWRIPFSNDPKSLSTAFAMEINNDMLIAQISYRGLQAFKTSTGAAVWAQPQSINICPGGEAASSFNMTVAAGKVFMGPFGGSCVLAFDATTGEKAWVFDAPNRATFDSKPIYVNGVVYAFNSRLWALDAQTGAALGVSAEELGASLAAPVVHDPTRNQVVTWDWSGLHAFRPLK